MSTRTDADQVLLNLWEKSGMVSTDDLADYKCISKDLQIPVTQAIKSSGLVTEHGLALSDEAQKAVLGESITADMAIRAIRIALQRKLSFPAAVQEAEKLHQKTQVVNTAGNELTDLMLKSGILTPQSLGQLLVLSNQSSVMVGQIMTMNKLVSSDHLLSALNALLMIKEESSLTRDNAIKGLKHAYRENISLEQALFELGLFVPPDSKTTRLGELFVMAGLISKADLAECIEIELFKEKQFGQILVERGLATTEQLQVAVNLLSSISNEELLPYQAARALKKVILEEKNIYEVMAELKATQDNKESRLGDLLVEAGVCTEADINQAISVERNSAVKVGSLLLKARTISDRVLYIALRLQTGMRLGYLAKKETIELLSESFKNELSLESVCSQAKIYLPSRMQWTWV